MKKMSILLLAVIVCLLSQPVQAIISEIEDEPVDGCSNFLCIKLVVVDDSVIPEPIDLPLLEDGQPGEPFCGFDCDTFEDFGLYPIFMHPSMMAHFYEHLMGHPDFPIDIGSDLPDFSDGPDDCGFSPFCGVIFLVPCPIEGPPTESPIIPEPATLALLGLGGLLLRKRK